MKIYIPSTSRSDCPNTAALRNKAASMGHDLVDLPSIDACAILLGDRSEMLTVARSCIEAHCRWIHVGAGCKTEGSWDQYVRDMLTAGCVKAWAYSEVAAYGDDFIQFAQRMYGVPVLDMLTKSTLPRKDYALVAINPVTSRQIREEHLIVSEIRFALHELKIDARWSMPNEDPQSRSLAASMQRAWPKQQLTRGEFATAIRECAVMVGNSSSALIEAPVLGTPFVDCGCRQQGRPLAMGVCGSENIKRAIRNARPYEGQSPYQHPQRKACESIIKIAESYDEWRRANG